MHACYQALSGETKDRLAGAQRAVVEVLEAEIAAETGLLAGVSSASSCQAANNFLRSDGVSSSSLDSRSIDRSFVRSFVRSCIRQFIRSFVHCFVNNIHYIYTCA